MNSAAARKDLVKAIARIRNFPLPLEKNRSKNNANTIQKQRFPQKSMLVEHRVAFNRLSERRGVTAFAQLLLQRRSDRFAIQVRHVEL